MRGIVRGWPPSNHVPADAFCAIVGGVALDSPRDRSIFVVLFLNAVCRAGSRPETPG